MGAFEHFPYTNFHDLNLDWIVQELEKLTTDVQDFISINAIKYANPIQWNITSQYEKNTVVLDMDGNAYLSVQAVPAGVSLDRTEYWTNIGNFSALWESVKEAIAVPDEGHSTIASAERHPGNLVWVNNTLLEVVKEMAAGDKYTTGDGGNSRLFNMQELLNMVLNEINTREDSFVELKNEIDTNTVELNNKIDKNTVELKNEINKNTGNIENIIAESKNMYEWLSWNGVPFIRTIDKENTESASYTTVQGGCCAGNYIVCAYIDNNLTTRVNNITKIVVFDKISGNIVRSAFVTAGHCNDMTYNPDTNELIIAPNEFWINGEKVRQNKLIVLDFSTLAIIREIPLSFSPYGICMWNGDYLTINASDYSKILKVKNNGSFEEFCSNPVKFWPPTYQTLSTDGSYIYIACAYPSTIYRISTDGVLNSTFDADGNRIYMPEGELEWCDFSDEFMFVGNAVTNFCGNYNYISKYGKNVTPLRLGFENSGILDIQVDNNSVSNLFPDVYNNSACKEIDEACWIAHFDMRNAYINVKNTGKKYASVNIYYDFTGRIKGFGAEIEKISTNVDLGVDNAIINNFYSNTCNVSMTKCTINGTWDCDRCVVSLSGCTITNPDGAIKANNCIIFIIGTITGTTPLLTDNSLNSSVFAKMLYKTQNNFLPLPKENSIQTYYDIQPVTLNSNGTLSYNVPETAFNAFRSVKLFYKFNGKQERLEMSFNVEDKTANGSTILRDSDGIYFLNFSMNLKNKTWSAVFYNMNNTSANKNITSTYCYFSQSL